MDIDYRAIGERIRKNRNQKGWTQEELAFNIGVTSPYLSRVENGSQKPSLTTIMALAEALHVTVNDLLMDSPPIDVGAMPREIELLFDGCSDYEKKFIILSASAIKNILRQMKRK